MHICTISNTQRQIYRNLTSAITDGYINIGLSLLIGTNIAFLVRMITAFPYWENRIAPVFDTARHFVIVESEHGKIITEEELISDVSPLLKIVQLKTKDVNTLICGAISKPVEITVLNYGIKVFAFISGNLREVIQAWIDGELNRSVFIMPGCYRQKKHQHGLRVLKIKEVQSMKGSGGGRGQGTGRGKGRNQGPLAAGPVGNCICPKCGYSETHERGVPCAQKQCPKCGTALTRQ